MTVQEHVDTIFDGFLHRKGVKKHVASLIRYLQVSDIDLPPA